MVILPPICAHAEQYAARTRVYLCHQPPHNIFQDSALAAASRSITYEISWQIEIKKSATARPLPKKEVNAMSMRDLERTIYRRGDYL